MTKVLHRDINKPPLLTTQSKGSYIYAANGTKILDAAGGAAVTSVGHSNPQVIHDICALLQNMQYAHSSVFTSNLAEQLAELILDNPEYDKLGLAKVAFINSGSEANESALKLVRQACVEKGEPQRTKVISRNMSYHGNTFGAMQLSGHKIRNKKFCDLFDERVFHKVNPPFYLHFKQEGESETDFVDRLINELDQKFQDLGPDTVMAFMAETIIGGTAGCVVPPKGYFEGVKQVCDKYGAYLVYDEVMCGSGRLGSFFAWESLTDTENWCKVVPDILTFGKAIGSGYLPLSGLVVNQNILDDLNKGSGTFLSRHTYQCHPISCAAGLSVQKYIKQNKLYDNINTLGPVLGNLLTSELKEIPIVSDVRGKGFFWCVEFLKDPEKNIAFDPNLSFSDLLHDVCLELGLAFLPCHGAVDGINGDQILICPSYDVDITIVKEIVSVLKQGILKVYKDL